MSACLWRLGVNGDPPPVEWSALRYGLRADRGRIRWERSGTSLRRSSPDQVRRMKDLEIENQRLRKAIADLTLDKLILQEAARGNF